MDVDSPLSPTLERKVAAQGTRLPSFREAKESLAETLEINLTTKQVERLTERIGETVKCRRDACVSAWESMPLMTKIEAPKGVDAPELAVVAADGGRLQLTERQHESGTHWREDKAAVLMEMTSPIFAVDPAPEIPEGFLDVTWAGRITGEIGKRAAAEPNRNHPAEPSSEEPSAADALRLESGLAEPADERCSGTTATDMLSPPRDASPRRRRQPPKLVRKQVVATLENSRRFSPQVASAAWALGFFAALRRAYVGDGQNWVWSLFEERFKPFGFVGILDIIHALTYVYAAATAARDAATGSTTYRRWMTWVWQGEVEQVIAELNVRQAELGPPQPKDGETHPRVIVAKSLGYLTNQRSRMDYPAYRRQGLPITSAYIESVIKQMNRRVKGSEKFWSGRGGEAILQLRAAQISRSDVWERIWTARRTGATGQRADGAA